MALSLAVKDAIKASRKYHDAMSLYINIDDEKCKDMEEFLETQNEFTYKTDPQYIQAMKTRNIQLATTLLQTYLRSYIQIMRESSWIQLQNAASMIESQNAESKYEDFLKTFQYIEQSHLRLCFYIHLIKDD